MTHTRKMLQLGFIVAGIVAVGATTVCLAIYVANRQSRTTAAGACRTGVHAAHTVFIQNDTVTPQHTQGALCDTLAIINKDNTVRLVAFGEHEDHQAYDGVGEKTLSKDQSLTLTMVKAGDFIFHDHIHDEVAGTFTVTEP